jgi:hypothetical protein
MLVASKTQSDQITHQLNLERDYQADLSSKPATPSNTSASFSALIP